MAGGASILGRSSLALLTFVVGGATGAGVHAVLTPPSVPRVVYVDRPAATASAVPTPEPSSVPTAEVPTARAATVTAPGPPSPSLSSSPTTRAGASQLDAERLVLDDARSALGQGDATAALETITGHEQRFAHPVLGEEREALRIQALVKAGRYGEARARADDFRRRSPKSLLLPAVDTAIASIP